MTCEMVFCWWGGGGGKFERSFAGMVGLVWKRCWAGARGGGGVSTRSRRGVVMAKTLACLAHDSLARRVKRTGGNWQYALCVVSGLLARASAIGAALEAVSVAMHLDIAACVEAVVTPLSKRIAVPLLRVAPHPLPCHVSFTPVQATSLHASLDPLATRTQDKTDGVQTLFKTCAQQA